MITDYRMIVKQYYYVDCLYIMMTSIICAMWLFTKFKKIHKREHDLDQVHANKINALQTDMRKRRNPWNCKSQAVVKQC